MGKDPYRYLDMVDMPIFQEGMLRSELRRRDVGRRSLLDGTGTETEPYDLLTDQ